jgi:hypothetical protein
VEDNTQYYVLPSSTLQVSGSTSLVMIHRGRRVVEIDRDTSRVLRCCSGVKSLRGHANVARQFHAASGRVIRHTLRRLVSMRVLERFDTPAIIRSRKTAKYSSHESPSDVVVVTADRPNALRRCLTSLTRSLVPRTRPPRILVIDGSRRHADEARRITTECRAEGPMHYVGKAEAAALRSQLRSCGAPDEILDFGLSPGPIGSNRNLSLLLTAGRDFVTVDDDIVCDVWASNDRDVGMVYGGQFDFRTMSFHARREAALHALPRAGLDVVTAHGRLLGKTLSDLLIEYRDGTQMEHMCGRLEADIANGRDRTVRITLSGVAGDSGQYCAHRILFLRGDVRKHLMQSRSAFDTAVSSREVRIIARTPIVTDEHGTCASYCMGISNRQLVPPFMPIGRGEDTVFGEMLAYCDRSSLLAHLPYGVVHDSERAAAWADALPSARQTTLAELLVWVTKTGSRKLPTGSPAEHLQWLAQVLDDIGSLTRPEFVRLLGEAAVALRCVPLARDADSKDGGTCPAYWTAALENYRRVFVDSVSKPEFLLPIEFHDAPSLDEGFRRAQAFMTSFGRLMAWWPEIWRAARDVDLGELIDPVEAAVAGHFAPSSGLEEECA